MNTTTTAAFVLATLMPLMACDLALYPEPSTYAGQSPPVAELSASADAMPDRDDVVTVEVAIVDVVMHRPADDAWVLMSADAVSADLVASGAAFKPVPMQPELYDRVAFGIAAVRVGSEAGWTDAAIDTLEVEIEGEFLIESDVVVRLAFDVEQGLTGDAADGFRFVPVVTASVTPSGS